MAAMTTVNASAYMPLRISAHSTCPRARSVARIGVASAAS